MREDLIERLRERAEFEDKRVLDEAKALGFVPEVYNGSQTGALLREAAELARRVEDAPAADIREDGGESALLSIGSRAGAWAQGTP